MKDDLTNDVLVGIAASGCGTVDELVQLFNSSGYPPVTTEQVRRTVYRMVTKGYIVKRDGRLVLK